MDINFSLPWIFLLLPLPLLIRLLLPKADELQISTIRVPFYAAMHSQLQHEAGPASRIRLIIAVVIWLLLLVSAARPQSVGDAIQLPVQGRNLMLAVDLSGSMEADDMVIGNRQVSRLAAVKAVAGEFIDRRVGDRLGLILFGDRAYLQTPLTLDRKTVKTLLQESAIGLAGKKTAIGDAIGLAVKRLRNEPEQNRVLILLTDGSNTAGTIEPLKAADLAAQEKIRIYTIGVGADSRMVRDLFGRQQAVSADIDEETLQAISDKTGGSYYRARDVESLLQIYSLLDEVEPIADDVEVYRPVNELYFWPLSIAMVLSILLALSKLSLLSFLLRREAKHA
ncbi:MAG: VWA domain-containing protein [Pseudomonadota bacterium]|nr:VWA domain-containing protein [Pseudomonadota bacterium]